MNNIIYFRFNVGQNQYHFWRETVHGTKCKGGTATPRPWDGKNRPERSDKNRAFAGPRPLTDRERVATNQPTKDEAKALKSRSKRR